MSTSRRSSLEESKNNHSRRMIASVSPLQKQQSPTQWLQQPEISSRENSLLSIKTIENFDFFGEAGPQRRLNKLVKTLEPIFTKILDQELPHIEDLLYQQTLKIKNLEEIRKDKSNTFVDFQDHRNIDLMKTQMNNQSFGQQQEGPVELTEKKKSQTMSSPQVIRRRWREVDRELRANFIAQVKGFMLKPFTQCCKEILIEHPMFESALTQIINLKEETNRRLQFQQKSTNIIASSNGQQNQSQQSLQQLSSFNQQYNSTGVQQQPAQQATESSIESVSVRLNLQSYMEHSSKMKEIIHNYESLQDQNKKLRDRINMLKMQHDKENHMKKNNQIVMADDSMKMLQESRLRRSRERLGDCKHTHTDEDLDNYEIKIVQVEFFDALEGLDPELKAELDYKLASVRNNFQDLLDINLQAVNKLKEKIQLMNDLSPESYSVANLSLIDIFMGCAKKESDPSRIWKSLNLAYGEDYFLTVVEEQYGKRFVKNYNALYTEVDKVAIQAEKEISTIEKVFRSELEVQKKIVEELKAELSMYRQNFREHLLKIQDDTKYAMEKDFEQREAKQYQQLLRREAELQGQIDQRDLFYKDSKQKLEILKTRVFFDKLKFVSLAKAIPKRENFDPDVTLDKILGFLTGDTLTAQDQAEQKYKNRIAELIQNNDELSDIIRKLDYRNSALEYQNKNLDQVTFERGSKVTSAENKQSIAEEEMRIAVTDLKAYKLMNENLQSMIRSHEREKLRLENDLKRYTRGKVKSNVLNAELHTKQQQNNIIKRGTLATGMLYAGVASQKSQQTTLVGIKGHVVHLSDIEYKNKFRKTFSDAKVQTDKKVKPIVIEVVAEPELHEAGIDFDLKVDSKQSIRSSKVSSRNTSVLKSQTDGSRQQNDNYKSQGPSKKTSMSQSRVNFKPSENKSFKEEENKSSKKDDSNYVQGDNDDEVGSSSSSQLVRKKSAKRPEHFDVGITCDLLRSRTQSAFDRKKQSRIGKLQLEEGQNNQHSYNNATAANVGNSQTLTQDGQSSEAAMSRLNPLFTQREMSHLQEISDKEISDQQTTSDNRSPRLVKDQSIVDIKTKNIGTTHNNRYQQMMVQNYYSKTNSKKGSQKKMQNGNSQQLSAGWRIINERLKDLQVLEDRNKSQIKYEVDKAFEMTKYLDETNFKSRDPATSQAYLSMVQMCLTRLDQLTPHMMVKKLEEEKNDLQKLLSVTPQVIRKNQNSVCKILNFVCLENLNNQIVRIFQSALDKSMPTPPPPRQSQSNLKHSQPKTSSGRPNRQEDKYLLNMDNHGKPEISSQFATLERDSTHPSARLNVKTPREMSKDTNTTQKMMLDFVSQPIQKNNSSKQQKVSDINNVHRQSAESIFTINSTNMNSSKQFQSMYRVQNSSNSPKNIKSTTAAHRFHSKGFQSLMTSSASNKNLQTQANQQEKQRHVMYREKMKNFMKNSSTKGLRAGDYNTAGATTISSIQFKRPHTSNQDWQQQQMQSSIQLQGGVESQMNTVLLYEDQEENQNQQLQLQKGIYSGENSIKKGLAEYSTSVNGRRTATTDLRQHSKHQHYHKGSSFQVSSKKKNENRMRQTSPGFFLQRPESSNLNRLVTVQDQPHNNNYQLSRVSSAQTQSYLDHVRTTGHRKIAFDQRNAYFNHPDVQIAPEESSQQSRKSQNSKLGSKKQQKIRKPSSMEEGYTQSLKKSPSDILVRISTSQGLAAHSTTNKSRIATRNYLTTNTDEEQQPQVVPKLFAQAFQKTQKQQIQTIELQSNNGKKSSANNNNNLRKLAEYRDHIQNSKSEKGHQKFNNNIY